MKETIRGALALADEIEENEQELLAGMGGYQWEHLGDATKDIHVLIAGMRELAKDRDRLLELLATLHGELSGNSNYVEKRMIEDALGWLDGGPVS